LGWTNAQLLQGEVPQAVAQLEGQFGRVDVIGSGKRLFGEGTVPTALRLAESATFPKGAVHLIYQRAGKPTFASMA
jgi:hypothetical protein